MKNEKRIVILWGLFLSLFLNSCNSQGTVNDCKTSYESAKKYLDSFLEKNNTNFLTEALSKINQSIKCVETRKSSIEIKIQILLLAKKYQQGYKFTDSLNDSDFKFKYKREMLHDFFVALDFDSKGNTEKSDSIYKEIIHRIQDYINEEDKSLSNSRIEVYGDLYLVKHMVLDSAAINHEIDTLINKYPHIRDYLEALKETINDLPNRSIGNVSN